MRKLNFIVIILSSFLVFSCGKEDFPENKINCSLYQTFWKGELTINDEGKSSTHNVNITFESDVLGNYRVENYESNDSNSSYGGFTYKVDGKILQIVGRFDNILNGDWWKTEESKNKLIFKRSFNEPLNTCTLIIKKQM